MAFSKIDIANGALALCGETSITSLSQDGKSARIVNRSYDLVRKRVLMKYRWNFAKARTTIAADPTAPDSGFLHRHRIPNDFLFLIGLYDDEEDQRNYTSSTIVYKLEGQFILCDSTPLKIVYGQDVTDTSQYDPMFATVLTHYLATHIFYDLTKGVDRYQALVGEREQAVKEAKFAHAIQNTPEILTSSTWVDSRYNDMTWFPRIGPVV
jgi:hypothetical protein